MLTVHARSPLPSRTEPPRDRTILLNVHSPEAEAAREEIALIVKNYHLTLYSFAADVIPRLVRFSSSFLMNSKSSSGKG